MTKPLLGKAILSSKACRNAQSRNARRMLLISAIPSRGGLYRSRCHPRAAFIRGDGLSLIWPGAEWTPQKRLRQPSNLEEPPFRRE
jgi:hypothetical protein